MRHRYIPPLLLRSCFAFMTLLVVFLAVASRPSVAASSPEHWVGTWATSPYAFSNTEATFGSADLTLRQIVHVSIGGTRVRVAFSNEFGNDALTIGAAHVALSDGGPRIVLGSANALTFGGLPSITIPAGGMVVSDPADLKLPEIADLAVSVFLPAQRIRTISRHGYADQTNYTSPGNAVSQKTLDAAKPFYSWDFLKGVDVLGGEKDGAIVCFGDSITDGALSTRDANRRWPDVLARRLLADKKTAGLGVLNEGIGGNRVLHDGTGPGALSRFDRDVLAQAGVKYVILMESINDIGVATNPHGGVDVVTAPDLIAGLQQLAERAHIHGIRVIGATLTPYVGAGYQSAEGEKIRSAVNDWVRTNKSLDGVIDFDMVTRDASNPEKFNPTMDSGDHLHPGDAGYKAMGESIDLKLFTGK